VLFSSPRGPSLLGNIGVAGEDFVQRHDGNPAMGSDTLDGLGEDCLVLRRLCESVEVNEVAPSSVCGTSLDRRDVLLGHDHFDGVADYSDRFTTKHSWQCNDVRRGPDRVADVDVDVECELGRGQRSGR
jgi:hypothetical protein